MPTSIITDFQSTVCQSGGTVVGLYRNADGQIEAIGAGDISPCDADDVARELILMALSIRRKANALGATPFFPFSVASILSCDTAMKTYDLETAGQFLNVSPSTMRQFAASGVVPGAKLGKRWVFTDEDLESYVRAEVKKQTGARRGENTKNPPTPERTTDSKFYPWSGRRRPAPPPSLSMTGE